MKVDRTKNAGKNMAMELTKNLYNVFMPFFLRTAMIYCLGIEYTGLGGLFTSILGVLNLAELGVGSAMVFSMYQPIAEDNVEKICALMKMYKIYYRIIGTIILVLGLLITPFVSHLISGESPDDINIYILFLMNLLVTVLSYWLFAYRNCLFQAHQADYLSTKVDLGLNIVFSVLQLISLFVWADYYLYVLINIVRQICSNVYKAVLSRKVYPLYSPKGEIDKKEEKDIQRRVKDLFTAKLGSTITNSTDAMVISGFLGLTILAQYQNYYYIFSAVLGSVGVVYNATRAGIGNSLICESKEKNLTDLNFFTFIIMWIIVFCTSCFLGIYQPFMILWIGKDGLLPFSIVICLCIMFAFRYYNCLLMTYKDAAGAWHNDRFRPLIAGMANLFMNIIMVQFWGVYGVLLSTILSEGLIEIPWLVRNLFSTVFHCSAKRYIITTLKYVFIAVCVVAISGGIVNLLPNEGLENFVIRGILSIIIPNVILIVTYFRSKELKETKKLVKRMLKRTNNA